MKRLLILLAILTIALAGCAQNYHVPSEYETVELDYKESKQSQTVSFDIYESGLKPNNLVANAGSIELLVFNNDKDAILKIESLLEEEIAPGQELDVTLDAKAGSYRILVDDVPKGMLIVN